MGDKVKPLLFGHLNKNAETITHGIFTRLGGVSRSGYSSLNLSYKCGDESEHVRQNREIVAGFFNIPVSNLLFPDQTHSNNVQIITKENQVNMDATDALITDKPGVAIGVLAADCIPLLFYDPVNEVVGAAHAGWRGTVGNIVGNCLSVMNANWGTNSADVLVGIGPGIQKRYYEVGKDVAEKLIQLPIELSPDLFVSANHSKYFVDLQKINYQLLCTLGIDKRHIELMDLCTYSHRDLFFSARRDGFKSGRFGAVIMLN